MYVLRTPYLPIPVLITVRRGTPSRAISSGRCCPSFTTAHHSHIHCMYLLHTTYTVGCQVRNWIPDLAIGVFRMFANLSVQSMYFPVCLSFVSLPIDSSYG